METHVAVGSPVRELAELAREREVDAIAMATHGRGGVARVVLGSVATGVLHRATAPLLLACDCPAGRSGMTWGLPGEA